MTRFNKILIANRGEIACRIIRCCHEMGIGTVAVFSDADRREPFVREADEAIHLGPAPSAESYLVVEKIIDAAKRSGAEAIHPGYGFLAEDAGFARACAEAGLVFIGPAADTIELLGSKKASKELVSGAGVPIVPSFDLAQPKTIDYPIMLKASAGGGGKGMHIVRSADELESSLASAKRIAQSAFGDSTMLAERYVENPRHIEIQILGDREGNLVHLFERECSIQRRHQKIIEESPAAGLDSDLRDAIAKAAIAVGKAANYYSAGTVEFIVAPNGEFYFLEVNTRLQVEHPVTECVTGVDLVREQIRIAQGEPLGLTQADIQQNGSAIECRLYAEDCEQDFLPCSGTLMDWHTPEVAGLRVDSGVQSGSEISIHYDPLVAKIITHGRTRAEAIQRMQRSLGQTSAAGLTTNRSFLGRVLAHPAFEAAKIHTGFLEEHKVSLLPSPPTPELVEAALLAAVFAGYEARREERQVLPRLKTGFRNNRWRQERVGFQVDGDEIWIGYEAQRDGSLRMQLPVPGIGAQASESSSSPIRVLRCLKREGQDLLLEVDGHQRHFRVSTKGKDCIVLVDGEQFDLQELLRFPEKQEAEVQGGCTAPMPAKVVKVLVQNGDSVNQGDSLIVLEAMKMEHLIKADAEGLVGDLQVQEGDQVQGGELLVVVAPA
jgi:acetyl/propionyl-CoA carboxylase alpha subunit